MNCGDICRLSHLPDVIPAPSSQSSGEVKYNGAGSHIKMFIELEIAGFEENRCTLQSLSVLNKLPRKAKKEEHLDEKW
jgi:hypothetical protein